LQVSRVSSTLIFSPQRGPLATDAWSMGRDVHNVNLKRTDKYYE
jgi:hypothetical protein